MKKLLSLIGFVFSFTPLATLAAKEDAYRWGMMENFSGYGMMGSPLSIFVGWIMMIVFFLTTIAVLVLLVLLIQRLLILNNKAENSLSPRLKAKIKNPLRKKKKSHRKKK
ncbi:hypothetical protein HYV44_02300 [Candidatus Microgenomates bacterium]|nr:hypothetical protein [Candidatus Microgenomates bacterium]